jgi:hypothetical protein
MDQVAIVLPQSLVLEHRDEHFHTGGTHGMVANGDECHSAYRELLLDILQASHRRLSQCTLERGECAAQCRDAAQGNGAGASAEYMTTVLLVSSILFCLSLCLFVPSDGSAVHYCERPYDHRVAQCRTAPH